MSEKTEIGVGSLWKKVWENFCRLRKFVEENNNNEIKSYWHSSASQVRRLAPSDTINFSSFEGN